jgi:hypothetical protein
MYQKHGSEGAFMTEHDDAIIQFVTERFERRLAEESGKIRVEIADGFGRLRTEMAEGFGKLRAEMIDRNAELLKWGLLFGASQTAALAAVIVALR